MSDDCDPKLYPYNPPGSGMLGFNNTRDTPVVVKPVVRDDDQTDETDPQPAREGEYTAVQLPDGEVNEQPDLDAIRMVHVTITEAQGQNPATVTIDVPLVTPTPIAVLTGLAILAPKVDDVPQNCAVLMYIDLGSGQNPRFVLRGAGAGYLDRGA